MYIRLVSKYYLGIRSRITRWVVCVAYMEERGDADRVLVGKPKGKIQFVRHKHRWEDNIKLDLQEVGGRHGLG